jgi:epoxyqueuosine reductase QueG
MTENSNATAGVVMVERVNRSCLAGEANRSGSLLAKAKNWGADLVGVADLEPFHEAIWQQGGDAVANYRWGIAIGIVLDRSLVDPLGSGIDRQVASNYLNHMAVVNNRLDRIAARLARHLFRLGASALAIPASRRTDEIRICGAVSHKLVARAAGLGWIGRSCLLITPQWGPRVRWATILTNARLSATGEPQPERCGHCSECASICPANAIAGISFHEDQPREARLDVGRCRENARHAYDSIGFNCCGLCLWVCPHGRKRPENESS